MNDVLLKCENVNLVIDGFELGGVKTLKSIRKNELTKIGSFLTDTPVYECIESSYELTFEIDAGKDCPFSDNDRILQVEICCDNKKVRYNDCVIKNMQTVIKPKGRICSEVTLAAKERTTL